MSAFQCPDCGEREFRMTVYKKGASGYYRKKDSALFECSACGFKERI